MELSLTRLAVSPHAYDDPTAINDNHAGRRKGGKELIGIGKSLDRPAQLHGARGFPLHSWKDKIASLRS